MLIIGDSVTFGAMVATERAFPHQLQQFMDCSKSWRVLNGGVTGYDSAQEAEWLELFGWQLAPDVVGVAFCRNDIYPSVRSQSIRPEPAGDVGRWVTEHCILASYLQRGVWYVSAKLGLASAAIKEAPQDPGADVPRPGWHNVDRAYRQIAEQARKRHVPVVLFIFPTLGYIEGSEPDDLTERLFALGAELEWTVIDLKPALAAGPRSWFLPGDPTHPNALGYRQAAAYAARHLHAFGSLPK
jgi:lysophospholipase L1-like esterase